MGAGEERKLSPKWSPKRGLSWTSLHFTFSFLPETQQGCDYALSQLRHERVYNGVVSREALSQSCASRTVGTQAEVTRVISVPFTPLPRHTLSPRCVTRETPLPRKDTRVSYLGEGKGPNMLPHTLSFCLFFYHLPSKASS